MLHHLVEQGLLDYQPYHGVRLRPSGERVALRMLRRHAVIEIYLMRVLHCPMSTAGAEAERLEHAVSEELVDRMAAALVKFAIPPRRTGGLAGAGTDGRAE
jgi:DtxR family Mn-dependent transcriptional regulator